LKNVNLDTNRFVEMGGDMCGIQKSWLVDFVLNKEGQSIEQSTVSHGVSAARALNDFFNEQSAKHNILRSNIDVTKMKIILSE
jgi:hypothetical protein